jgi:threonine/homoserine/homoserine lactone efflux protein
MIGHSILELALVAAICLGLGVYLKAATVMAATALLGGSILLCLGVQMLRTAGRHSIRARSQGVAAPGRTPVIADALTSLANPYWTLWWATFGLGYLMRISGKGLPGIAVFFAGHIAADFASYDRLI